MNLLLKALTTWLFLVILAIFNGGLREKVLIPLLGESYALPVSGIFLSVAIFVVTFFVVPFLRIQSSYQAWFIGITWVMLTLVFEFLFGHFFLKVSWERLFNAYDPSSGNLLLVVLLVTLCSPYLVSKIERFI